MNKKTAVAIFKSFNQIKFTGNTLESLGKFLSSRLRQEEGGESTKERAKAKDKEGKDRGELGKVDDHGGEEDGNSSHNLTKGNLNSRLMRN